MLFRDNRDFCQDLSRRSRDLSRNLDIVEAFWVWKWWKVSTDWEILTIKYKNPRTSWSRSRQTVKKRQNFQILTNFSNLIETFWSGRFSISIEISRSSRLTFWPCQDFLNCRDKSRPPRLHGSLLLSHRFLYEKFDYCLKLSRQLIVL